MKKTDLRTVDLLDIPKKKDLRTVDLLDIPKKKDLRTVDLLDMPKKKDSMLLDFAETINAQSVDLKSFTNEDLEKYGAQYLANNSFFNLGLIASAGFAGSKFGAAIGTAVSPGVGTLAGGLIAGGLASIGAAFGLNNYDYSKNLLKMSEEDKRQALTKLLLEEKEFIEMSDLAKGARITATMGKLPQDEIPQTFSGGMGSVAGMIMSAGALSTGVAGAGFGFSNAFIGGLTAESGLSDYNKNIGMGKAEAEAFKSAMGATIGTFASSLLFMKASPYIFKSMTKNLVNPMAVPLASVGKEAFENVGWAITSNAIKVLSDKSLGIKNDTQIIDENELLPLAILGGGTSLLATGGSLVMKGLGKGIAKGTNRFTEKVKTDKIIKNTGDAVFYSTNVENIRTRLNPLYQNNVKNLDEVVFDNDWMDLVLKEIRTVYNSKTITKEDAIAEVLVNLDAMEYVNIKNYKKIYLGLQDL